MSTVGGVGTVGAAATGRRLGRCGGGLLLRRILSLLGQGRNVVAEGGCLRQSTAQDAAHLGEVGGDRVALTLELLELAGGHLGR